MTQTTGEEQHRNPFMGYWIFGRAIMEITSQSINNTYFPIVLYCVILLAFRYVSKLTYIVKALLSIFVFYGIVLIYTNYDMELAYRFYKYVALQGRYLFPVISIGFVLVIYANEQVKNRFFQLSIVRALVLLFLYSGRCALSGTTIPFLLTGSSN